MESITSYIKDFYVEKALRMKSKKKQEKLKDIKSVLEIRLVFHVDDVTNVFFFAIRKLYNTRPG